MENIIQIIVLNVEKTDTFETLKTTSKHLMKGLKRICVAKIDEELTHGMECEQEIINVYYKNSR